MQPNYGTEGHVCGKQLCNKWALKTRLMILRKEKEVIVTRTPQRARHPNYGREGGRVCATHIKINEITEASFTT